MPEHDPRPEERFSDEPAAPIGDIEPIKIPDLRKRDPWHKTALRGLAFGVLIVVGIIGYTFYGEWNEKKQIERAIRAQYPPQAGAEVDSLSLERVGGGKYTGTLVTVDGATFDVFAEHDGRMISWVFQIPLELRKTQLRETFEKNNQPVKSVELRYDEKKLHQGKIVLQSGDEFDIRDARDAQGRLQTEFEPTRSTFERWVEVNLAESHNDKASPITLRRESKETYTGSCRGESGVEYELRLEPNPEQKESYRIGIAPKPEHVVRWLTHQLKKSNGVKVKTLTLVKRGIGDYAGKATLEGGAVWEVRAGMPPAWAKTAKGGIFAWDARIAPESYGAWVTATLARQHAVGFELVKLTPEGSAHVGTATDENGKRYRVKVWLSDAKAEDGPESGWPEMRGKLRHEAVPLK